jgi:hypothetical protein
MENMKKKSKTGRREWQATLLFILVLSICVCLLSCGKEKPASGTYRAEMSIQAYSEGTSSELLRITEKSMPFWREQDTLQMSNAIGTQKGNTFTFQGKIHTAEYLLDGTFRGVRSGKEIHGFWQGTIHRYGSDWGLFAEGGICFLEETK